MAVSLRAGRGAVRRRLRYLVSIIAACALMVTVLAVTATAAPGSTTVSGVLNPLNGVWLESADGGHYWDVNGNGICRVDNSGAGSVENLSTCDLQSKKPTQVAVGPQRSDGTYYLYVSDMSSTSIGPLRLVYDPNAESGAGDIVPNSANILGGESTVGFFGDSTGDFRSSSVALGPCDAVITTPCTALYVAFEKSKRIERINFVDQPLLQQSIETISQTNDIRKGVRYGIATFRNADGTTDLYIDELGSEGVSVVTDVATCTASEGSPVPGSINPPVNQLGGCAATIVQGITTNFAQGIAVQDNPDGTGRYLYIGDSPENTTAHVLRYHPATGFQDVVSSTVTPYDSLLNPGQTVSTYTALGGLAVDQQTGDLYIADDPTLLNELAGETAVGHIFRIAGDGTQTAPADCTGSATVHCVPPSPPATVTGSLYGYGVTSPAGGLTWLPSDNGGHVWLADEYAGLCRFDVVPAAPELHASNSTACDDGTVLGSGGQAVYDDSVVSGTTNQHYVYVAQNDHLSPGVVRFTYDPGADSGDGDLVPNSAVIMAPNAGLNGDRANGLALGPCKAGAPVTCKHSLYVAGLLDGFIRRINNPEDDPRDETVDVVAETTDQKNGIAGRGINGAMAMLGDSLYLPEDDGFTVVNNASTCGVNSSLCATLPLNIGIFGSITGTALAVDPNPQHSTAGLVYASESPDSAAATIYQYDVATGTSRLYLTQGQMPPAGSAATTVYCTLTCTRPADPAYPPGALVSFRFAQGLFVNPNSDDGTLFITDDASQGTRTQRGHIWTAPFLPYPSSDTARSAARSAPRGAVATPADTHTCASTVLVPALGRGRSAAVRVTSHRAGSLDSTWQIPAAQAAGLTLSSGSPGVVAAQQVSADSTTFDVTTASKTEPAATYTARFTNNGKAFHATTAMITYDTDAATPCPASPLVGHVD